jgi:hypothetical protein
VDQMNTKLKKIMRLISESAWFDQYHIHPSLCGHKKRDLRTICGIERTARAILSRKFREYQCFILIDMKNSDYDAIYIHTENDNHTDFPIELKRGTVTRNADAYNGIVSTLKRHGYACYKLKGSSAIVAIHD